MVWTKKFGAPDFAYPAEVTRAWIQGTPDAWIGDWLYLLGGVPINVPLLCAMGPQTCAPFDQLDFLSAVTSGNRFGIAVNFAQLLNKLSCFCMQRVFAAYCQDTGPTVCQTLDRVSSWNWATPSVMAKPSTSIVRVRYELLGTEGGATGVDVQLYACNDATGSSPVKIDEVLHLTGAAVTHINVDSSQGGPFLRVGGSAYPGGSGQNATCIVCIDGTDPEGPFVPPDIYQPPTAIPPPAGNYPDIAALGAELDRIENKLHLVLEQGIQQEIASIWPLVESGEVETPTNDEDVELGDAAGFIVTVSNPGLDVDESFGAPIEMNGVGRVVLGNGVAWLPPIPITVSPLLLTNLPATITVCRVHVYVPATFTVQRLARAAPTG